MQTHALIDADISSTCPDTQSPHVVALIRLAYQSRTQTHKLSDTIDVRDLSSSTVCDTAHGARWQASGRRSSRVSARVVREQEEARLAEMQARRACRL